MVRGEMDPGHPSNPGAPRGRWRPLRTLWEKRKRSAFPRGAVTFHLAAWTRRRLPPEDLSELAAELDRSGFDEFLVIHGSAWLAGGRITLVTGPPGVGKSSALRGLEARGHGLVSEEGLVLVGVRPGSWEVVRTGTLDLLTLASRIGGWIRRLMGIQFSLPDEAAVRQRGASLRNRDPRQFRAANLSFSLAAAIAPRPRRPVDPGSFEVAGLVVMPCPGYAPDSFHLRRGGEVEEIADLALLAPPAVAVRSVSPLGERNEVVRRLREEVLRA